MKRPKRTYFGIMRLTRYVSNRSDWIDCSSGGNRMTIEFTYWDNSVVPPKFLFQVVEEDILVADALFKQHTGIDPVKKPTVGCSIKKMVDELEKVG